MTHGRRPRLGFNNYFLFAGDKDVIHIFANHQAPATTEQEQNIVHHVSFSSDNYQETMQRIAKLDLAFSMGEVPGTLIKQIFVRGSENLIIEIQAQP
ncbi:hypothetical protein [Shewanella saliphila]|uniref:VOC domain-containing protein n=1 Tax=Shewanella saliphila TaxID=2282698 RepID=A0ABQ2Q9N8_9GAMM|nr:hypothetical protein [Shewanella saliphila]MCL1102864.1 hypothetical protein [Shewanella saliphila]GGP63124.1 hypothetical protein GCM10009409_31000 [Shewanella saliphila]